MKFIKQNFLQAKQLQILLNLHHTCIFHFYFQIIFIRCIL